MVLHAFAYDVAHWAGSCKDEGGQGGAWTNIEMARGSDNAWAYSVRAGLCAGSGHRFRYEECPHCHGGDGIPAQLSFLKGRQPGHEQSERSQQMALHSFMQVCVSHSLCVFPQFIPDSS